MRVVICDDSLLLREGLARLLTENGIEVVSTVKDADALHAAVASHQLDIAIVDVRMPPTHTDEGLRAAHRLRAEHPELAVLVLSQWVEAGHALDLFDRSPSGVGYLLKDRVTDVDDLVGALHRLNAGGSVLDPEVVATLVVTRRRDGIDRLTERERDVLVLMAEGRTNVAIAQRLTMGRKTVESHVNSIFTRLNLEPAPDDHRRVLAVLAYLRRTPRSVTPPVP